ncbi:MAG: hypothetical protein HY262_10670 [Chloroflexi bacterium]|nr:hypothetical protein [Chloroflexota bacterium]
MTDRETSRQVIPGPPYPAAFHVGAGHMIVHGNRAFMAAFGERSIGQPAREAMVDLPSAAFELMDLVYQGGKPLACRIMTPAGERRLVVAARRDPETGETYGVTTHLRPVGREAGRPA